MKLGCELCAFKGHVLLEGKWHRCACTERLVNKQRLGIFDTDTVVKDTPLIGLLQEDLLIEGPLTTIRSHVAGAIMHLAGEGKVHGAMDAYRLVEIFLDKVDEFKSTQDLAEFDLFILMMGFGDIANRRLPEIILQAMNRREMVQKPTWVILGIPIGAITQRYDAAVYERLTRLKKARVE